MTREEVAANVLWWASKRHYPGDQMDITEHVIEAFDVAVAALRGPQPDPITGLVPCGCGGRSFVWEGRMHSDTYYVQCLFCGVRTVDRVKKADAIREFNTAMGWKGGAE